MSADFYCPSKAKKNFCEIMLENTVKDMGFQGGLQDRESGFGIRKSCNVSEEWKNPKQTTSRMVKWEAKEDSGCDTDKGGTRWSPTGYCPNGALLVQELTMGLRNSHHFPQWEGSVLQEKHNKRKREKKWIKKQANNSLLQGTLG